MASSFDRFQKKKLRSSYFSLFFINLLILFLLGGGVLMILKYKDASQLLKQRVPLQVFLKDNVVENQWVLLGKTLSKTKYATRVKFISKQQAAKDYATSLGEDFVAVLGENPLKNAFKIHLKPDFLTTQKLQKIEKDLLQNAYVDEVVYDAKLVSLLNTNLKKIGGLMLVVFFGFVLILFVLINNTIRLALYTKRFTIKTMQLVGARGAFIRRPFIFKSVMVSILSGIFACFLLVALLYLLQQQYPEFHFLQMRPILFAGVFVNFIACLIAWCSTYFVTCKFLRLHIDGLYH